MGAGNPSGWSLAAARELGALVAERGWIVLTGGRAEGVMAAASSGAKQIAGSVTIGILPGASGGAGPDVDIAIFTGMGEARNAINVLTSDVIVACGVEGPGTVSEVALALKAEKPVVLLGASATARQLFADLTGRVRPLEAAEPHGVVRLIEEKLGIPKMSWRA
jgi:uncharacterized protein (TIGR00725 family)